VPPYTKLIEGINTDYNLEWYLQIGWKLGVSEETYRQIINNRSEAFDILWNKIEEHQNTDFVQQRLGLFRNDQHLKAEMFKHENKLKESLQYYLLVAALDLKGESPYERDLRFQDGVPLWELDIFIAPGIKGEIQNLKAKLNIDYDELKFMFYNTIKMEPTMLSDFSLENAWKKLKLARNRKK
jgi:hypothetical protein